MTSSAFRACRPFASVGLAAVVLALALVSPALPNGLSRLVDPERVGMFGQSAGGIAAAQGMLDDRRIKAGIDLDGSLECNREPSGTNLTPVAVHGLDRPFMLMGREGINHLSEPSWRAFWTHSKGWHRDLTVRGSRHQTYTDLVAIMPQAGLAEDAVERRIGTVDPTRPRSLAGPGLIPEETNRAAAQVGSDDRFYLPFGSRPGEWVSGGE
jgi:hypothetical protein